MASTTSPGLFAEVWIRIRSGPEVTVCAVEIWETLYRAKQASSRKIAFILDSLFIIVVVIEKLAGTTVWRVPE
jgi:hypothetical protein